MFSEQLFEKRLVLSVLFITAVTMFIGAFRVHRNLGYWGDDLFYRFLTGKKKTQYWSYRVFSLRSIVLKALARGLLKMTLGKVQL
jgi:hypothetical protein